MAENGESSHRQICGTGVIKISVLRAGLILLLPIGWGSHRPVRLTVSGRVQRVGLIRAASAAVGRYRCVPGMLSSLGVQVP